MMNRNEFGGKRFLIGFRVSERMLNPAAGANPFAGFGISGRI
ncbi:MAG: hypothetical protein ABSC11_06530 [Smithella sp.]|jgi:hypothetical protein